jgi:hypothetical protein
MTDSKECQRILSSEFALEELSRLLVDASQDYLDPQVTTFKKKSFLRKFTQNQGSSWEIQLGSEEIVALGRLVTRHNNSILVAQQNTTFTCCEYGSLINSHCASYPNIAVSLNYALGSLQHQLQNRRTFGSRIETGWPKMSS